MSVEAEAQLMGWDIPCQSQLHLSFVLMPSVCAQVMFLSVSLVACHCFHLQYSLFASDFCHSFHTTECHIPSQFLLLHE